MSTPTPNCVSATVNPTFSESYIASLMLLRYRWPVAIFLALSPSAGLFLLMTPLMGYRLGVVEISLALFGISSPLLIILFAVWLSRRRNRLAQGPRTYSFDAEGMHIRGKAFSQTILWEAILRIRRTRRFLFVFIGSAQAYCIPLRVVSNPQFFDDLRSIAGAGTDFGLG
jgi:hypothetical protein